MTRPITRLVPRRVFLATAALTVVVIATALAVLWPSAGSGDERDLVAVADQGFSVVGGSKLTYAFVVENKSSRVALEGAGYEARFFDASGRLLAERSGPMPIVMAGAQAVVAEESIEVAYEPAQMTVAIVGGEMRRAEGVPSLPQTSVFTGHSPGEGGGRADATADIWNPFAATLTDVYLAAVYFHVDGRIVGGGSRVVESLGPGSQREGIVLANAPSAGLPLFYASPLGDTVATLVAAWQAGEARPAPSNVSWVPATAPLYSGPEETNPHAVEGGAPAAQVYVLEDGDEPRLLYESGRWLYGLEWHRDTEVMLEFRSKKVDPPPEARGPYYIPTLRGTLGLSTTTSDIVWQARGDANQRLIPSPVDGRIIFEASDQELYLLEPGAGALKLQGIGERVFFGGWSPNGDAIIVFSYETVTHPTPVAGVLYLVPLEDGPARRIHPPLDAFQRETATWSADGSKIAFVAGVRPAPLGGWQARGDVYVYDVAADYTSRLTTDRAYGSTRPAWSDDGSLLIIEGDLIDASSGAVTSLVSPPVYASGGVISPDGRYFVVSEHPYVDGPSGCPPGALQNRTHAYDRLTGQSRTLLDCAAGYYFVRTWDFAWERSPRWLAGNRELVVHTTPIYCCHTSTNRLSVLNAETGSLRVLFERAEGNLDAIASPDGTRVLVTGGGLRIFDAARVLQRTITVPEGHDVQEAAWSPDGKRIAYVIVPIGMFDGV